MKDLTLAQGVFATYTTPEEASAPLHNEIAKWIKVISEGKPQPD